MRSGQYELISALEMDCIIFNSAITNDDRRTAAAKVIDTATQCFLEEVAISPDLEEIIKRCGDVLADSNQAKDAKIADNKGQKGSPEKTSSPHPVTHFRSLSPASKVSEKGTPRTRNAAIDDMVYWREEFQRQQNSNNAEEFIKYANECLEFKVNLRDDQQTDLRRAKEFIAAQQKKSSSKDSPKSGKDGAINPSVAKNESKAPNPIPKALNPMAEASPLDDKEKADRKTFETLYKQNDITMDIEYLKVAVGECPLEADLPFNPKIGTDGTSYTGDSASVNEYVKKETKKSPVMNSELYEDAFRIKGVNEALKLIIDAVQKEEPFPKALLLCPISQKLLTDSVWMPDGNTYDKKTIIAQLEKTPSKDLWTSPKTKETYPIKKANLIPNLAINGLCGHMLTHPVKSMEIQAKRFKEALLNILPPLEELTPFSSRKDPLHDPVAYHLSLQKYQKQLGKYHREFLQYSKDSAKLIILEKYLDPLYAFYSQRKKVNDKLGNLYKTLSFEDFLLRLFTKRYKMIYSNGQVVIGRDGEEFRPLGNKAAGREFLDNLGTNEDKQNNYLEYLIQEEMALAHLLLPQVVSGISRNGKRSEEKDWNVKQEYDDAIDTSVISYPSALDLEDGESAQYDLLFVTIPCKGYAPEQQKRLEKLRQNEILLNSLRSLYGGEFAFECKQPIAENDHRFVKVLTKDGASYLIHKQAFIHCAKLMFQQILLSADCEMARERLGTTYQLPGLGMGSFGFKGKGASAIVEGLSIEGLHLALPEIQLSYIKCINLVCFPTTFKKENKLLKKEESFKGAVTVLRSNMDIFSKSLAKEIGDVGGAPIPGDKASGVGNEGRDGADRSCSADPNMQMCLLNPNILNPDECNLIFMPATHIGKPISVLTRASYILTPNKLYYVSDVSKKIVTEQDALTIDEKTFQDLRDRLTEGDDFPERPFCRPRRLSHQEQTVITEATDHVAGNNLILRDAKSIMILARNQFIPVNHYLNICADLFLPLLRGYVPNHQAQTIVIAYVGGFFDQNDKLAKAANAPALLPPPAWQKEFREGNLVNVLQAAKHNPDIVNQPFGIYQSTILIRAIVKAKGAREDEATHKKYIQFIHDLLVLPINLDVQDGLGNTALHRAVQDGNDVLVGQATVKLREIAILLVEKGASRTTVNNIKTKTRSGLQAVDYSSDFREWILKCYPGDINPDAKEVGFAQGSPEYQNARKTYIRPLPAVLPQPSLSSWLTFAIFGAPSSSSSSASSSSALPSARAGKSPTG